MTELGTLHAPLKVEFDYTRSLGPTLSAFMTGLKRRQILGGVLSDGTVAVPPPEYDGRTFDPITELRPVADVGVIQSWAWVREPVPGQPLDKPFAFAQIKLDGADRPLLHAVAVESPDQIETGMRVRAVWADEPVGAITDIRWFEPEGSRPATTPGPEGEAVEGIIAPVKLSYDYAASPEESKFFRGLADGKLIGQRCPVCEKVYVPPRGACPVDGVPTTDEVEVADHGTITTICIVNVPSDATRTFGVTPPVPVRVSNTRVGVSAWNPAAFTGNQPTTSPVRFALAWVYRHTVPVGETGAITRLGTIWPAT